MYIKINNKPSGSGSPAESEDIMKNYVLASHDFGSHRLVYYAGSYWAGGTLYGDVTEAVRFDYEELLDFLKDHQQYLGFCVIRIEDCTFEVFKTNADLVKKFSQLEYAVR